MFQLPLLFNLILLISATPPKRPTPQVTALFGPRNNFICNAVVLAKGRLLTTANCVVFINNGTQRLGAPEDFHVALNATDIERFVRSGKPARRWIVDKLRTRGGEKFDNKFSNGILEQVWQGRAGLFVKGTIHVRRWEESVREFGERDQPDGSSGVQWNVQEWLGHSGNSRI